MKEMIILKPNGLESTVYEIEDLSLLNLCSQLFSQVSACIDIQTPAYSHLYKVIKCPIKVLQNKNNKHLNTSLKLSLNDFIYECFMQKSEQLQQSWYNMCEDFMQINISSNVFNNVNDNNTYTFYAIKNRCDSTLKDSFKFFVQDNTLSYLDTAVQYISQFLNANQLRHDYSSIYKKILQKKSFEDFSSTLESSTLKNEICQNQAFLFSCLYYYSNPAHFLTHLLGNNIIEAKWKNGLDFLESFSSYFNEIPLDIVSPIIDHYERFILKNKLQQSLPVNSTKNVRKKI